MKFFVSLNTLIAVIIRKALFQTISQNAIFSEMGLKNYKFNGICGPRSPAFEPNDVNCDFEFGSCAWTTIEKPHFKWKLASGNPSAQTFLQKFNTTIKPNGNFLLLIADVGAKSKTMVHFISCPILCSNNMVKITLKNWQSDDRISLEMCFRDGDTSTSDLEICAPIKPRPEPTSEILPESEYFTILFRVSGMRPGDMVALDDIILDFEPCIDERPYPLLSDKQSFQMTTPIVPSTTTQPVGPIYCEGKEGLAQCNLYCSKKLGKRWSAKEMTCQLIEKPDIFKCVCIPEKHTSTMISIKIPCMGNDGKELCFKQCSELGHKFSGEIFAGTSLRALTSAGLVIKNLKLNEERVFRIGVYVESDRIHVRLCFNQSRSDCREMTDSLKENTFGSWIIVSYNIPTSTKQIIIVAQNFGRKPTPIGFDNLQLLLPHFTRNPHRATVIAC